MKIDSLRFKNINSLKGEWTVNFDQSPLVDAGVFAITGPNGSGKSSILDVITLGLYGETSKFDHPSAHVMTKQTDESFAEVVFSLSGEQFRSSWAVQRKQGQLAPAEMKIVRLNGSEEIIENQPSKVRDFIAELTGMDFRRFTRSIVLAQGDFAAFLNALDNERLDILEKIVGTNVYEDYKQDILETADQEKNTLKQLEQNLASIVLKSPAQIEALEHDLIDFKAQNEECLEQRNILEQEHASIQEIESVVDKIADIEQSIEQVQDQTKQLKDDIAEVESIKDFAVIESGVEESEHKQQQLATSQETLSAYRNEISQLEETIGQLTIEDRQPPDLGSQSVTEQIKNLDSLKSRLDQLKIDYASEVELLASLEEQLPVKQSTIQTVTAWLQEHQGDRVLLDAFPNIADLKSIRTDIATIKQQKTDYIKKVKTQASMSKKKDAEEIKLKKEVANLQKSIHKHKADFESLLSGQTLVQTQEDLAEVQDHLDTYKSLVVIASDYSKLPKQKGSSFQGFKGWTKTKEDQQGGPAEEYEALLQEQEQANNILATLEKAVEWEARLKKQEAERQLLVDGEPCPLCGSMDHPFVKTPLVLMDSQKALADQQKQVMAIEKQAQQLVIKIKKSHVVSQGISDKNKLRVELESYWLELCTRLNMVSEDFTVNDLKAAKKWLADQNKAISEYTAKIKNHQSLQTKIEQQQTLLEQKITALETVVVEQDQLKNSDDINPQESKTLDLTLADSEHEEQALTTKVTEQLVALGEKLPAKGKEDKVLQRLQQRQQAFQEQSDQQLALQQELITLTEKLETSRTKSQQLNQQREQCTTSLHVSEVASLHLAMVEKQKLIADKEQGLEQQQQSIKVFEQQFKATLETTGVSDIDAAQKLLESKQNMPEMQQQLTHLIEQPEQLKLETEQQQAKLKTLQEQALTTMTLEEIVAKQKQIGSKLSIANQEIRTAESILAQQDSLKSKFNLLQEKVQQQVELSEHSQAEAKLLETQSPAVTKRKIQQMMIAQLMTKSNQFLENISGRYCIHQRASEQGLALEIEDKAEGSVYRSPQTLSGGEGFVVSLSLALGLSSMGTQGQAVESLFLDEGFGTLDEETLYVVLSTLKSLHHSGKMVGVISHVKELKERIRTQIRLIKESSGHSSLEVVS